MGRVAGQPYLPGRFAHQVRLLMQLAKISVAGFKQRKTLLQHFAIEGAYRQIKERTTVPLENELTLFAVDALRHGGLESASGSMRTTWSTCAKAIRRISISTLTRGAPLTFTRGVACGEPKQSR